MPTHAERIEVLERLVWCLVDDLIAHARKTRDLVNQTDGPDEWIAAHLKEQP